MAMNARLLNGLGFLACVAMMAYALYAEHQLLLEPCPLCVFQRLATIVLGAVFLVAALHNPQAWGRRVYAVLLLLAGGAGFGVAAWHVRLQNLPADEVPACGPGLDYIIDAFPLSDALRMIFTGSGECATIDWRFLGLTMPAWVAICFAVLLAAGLYANLKAPRA
ncbi:MAG: disulfide bond formation protein B [Woeseia sp.]